MSQRPEAALRSAGMGPSELASVAEIAELLGVPKRTAARYVNRDDFPAPVDVLEVGRIWRRDDVADWGQRMLPLKPGPTPRGDRT
jgi:prophage regulatory protein